MEQKTYRKFNKKRSKKRLSRKGKSLRCNRKHGGGNTISEILGKRLISPWLYQGYTIFLVNRTDAERLLRLEFKNLNDYFHNFNPYLYYINFPREEKRKKEQTTSILISPINAITISYDINLGKKYNTVEEFMKPEEQEYVMMKIQKAIAYERENNDTREFFTKGWENYKYEHNYAVTIVKVLTNQLSCHYTIDKEDRRRIEKLFEMHDAIDKNKAAQQDEAAPAPAPAQQDEE
jgi:hypothetical protein